MRRLAFALLLTVTSSTTATMIYVPADRPTIQAGIDAAYPGDIVVVSPGLYFEHDIYMKSFVELRSESGQSNCVTIDAEWEGFGLVCDGLASYTSISGFTITRAYRGMLCREGSEHSVTNCTFSFNTNASGTGRGVECIDSSPLFTTCTFEHNIDGRAGAGLYCSNSAPTVSECAFMGNTSTQSFGGAVRCEDASVPVFADCTFTDNMSRSGGAVYISEGSVASFTNCLFFDNHGGNGGAIHCAGSSSSLSLEGCTFIGNHSTGGGGGVYSSGETGMIVNCSFSDNSADYSGGAIGFIGDGAPSMTNCAIEGNNAQFGGGIYCGSGTLAVITASTIVSNSCTSVYGSGIYISNYSAPMIENCIVADNYGAIGVYSSLSEPILVCCDIFNNEGGDWSGDIADQFGINGNISEDPDFCLVNFPDLPYSLQSSSPCAAENNTECGQIGAYGIACSAVSVPEEQPLPVDWGTLKAIY